MSTNTDTPRTGVGLRALLAVGYLALAVGVLVAYVAPAEGYELSIYGATPAPFWVAVLVALTVSMLVAFYAPSGYTSLGGLVLGAGAVFATGALPLVRNYEYYGIADAMTHLGWTRDVLSGTLNPLALFYPGIHTYGAFTSEVLGVAIPRALMLVVLSFLLVYLVFVPFTVRAITPHRGAMILGVFAGLLVLPLNHIATHYLVAHSYTQAMLLFPMVLYLIVNYVTSSERGPLLSFSAVGGLLALVSIGTVVYHPMQAANVLVLMVAFLGAQWLYRRIQSNHPVTATRPLYSQAGVLGLAFVLWVAGRGRFLKALDVVWESVSNYFLRGGTDPTQISQRTGSLTSIGSGITEVFLKLFLVGAIYSAITGLLMLASLAGRLDDTAPDTDALVKHLTVGLALLLPYSFLFFVGSASRLFFRNFGFIMAIVTILGTVALHRYVTGVSRVLSTGPTRVLTIVGIGVMLVLTLIILFPSPYIYMPNGQATEQSFSGFDTAFDNEAEGVEFYGLRQGPWRWRQGVNGVGGPDYVPNVNSLNASQLQNVTSVAENDRYFVMNEQTFRKEVIVYHELRYSADTLFSVRANPDVHRVQANGDMRLYYVDGGSNSTAAPG